MVSGGGGSAPVVALQECENLVFFKISLTSEFLFTSSPSFSPEVKCVQTKQKVVWFNVMLMETDPYQNTTKRSFSFDSNSITRGSFNTMVAHLVTKKPHHTSPDVGDLQIRNVFVKICSNPHAQENSHHLFTCCKAIRWEHPGVTIASVVF